MSVPPPRQDRQDPVTGETYPDHTSTVSQVGHEDPRVNGRLHRGSSVLAVPPQRAPVEYLGSVDTQVTDTTNPLAPQNQVITSLVAPPGAPFSRQVPEGPPMASTDHRCQPPRMGGGLPSPNGSGTLVSPGDTTTNKHSRASGSSPGTPSLAESARRTGNPDTVRQRHHGSLPEPSGRHQKPSSTQGSEPHSVLGRSPRRHAICSIHPRTGKLAGRLPQSPDTRPRRMVPKTIGLSDHHTNVGTSTRGPHGVQAQPPGRSLYGALQGSTGHGSRCHDNTLGLPSLLRVSPSSTTAQGHQKDQEGTLQSDPHSSTLAQKGLVLGTRQPQQGRSLVPATVAGSSLPGTHIPSQSGSTTFDGMATESIVLRRKGFSTGVIRTMIAARKPASAQNYHRVWKRYKEWCDQAHLPWDQFSPIYLLEFLQAGLTKGLSLASLKSQISALSVLFQTKIAELGDVRTFLQGVAHLVPPYRAPIPTWDLNLVLRALQEAPFEPMNTIPLLWLTWKTTFLVAIASARRVSEISALSCQHPYLIFHNDRAVLRTVPSFLPKVVTDFHLNQEITLPTFCPHPKNPKEMALHSLDPVRALKIYLARTKELRTTHSLFVLPTGPHKGSPAPKVTISRWIKETIRRAYIARGRTSPLQVRAHSTRAVSTSWAFRNRASAEQLCKAATWSSIHSFTKFYKFEVFATESAQFGRRVLQAVIDHI
uniref:Core-binding (CB) domain-containing protein n=1 Tax=Xenopus tropicalis TaxID=8364 RepID=A0A803JKH4_XENTR